MYLFRCPASLIHTVPFSFIQVAVNDKNSFFIWLYHILLIFQFIFISVGGSDTRSYHVAQDDLGLTIILPQPPEC